MSAEAMARLRKYVDGTATLGDSRSRVDDLRALLDAHAALQKDAAQARMEADVHAATLRDAISAHTEALDALEKLEDACSSVASWSEECLDFSDGSRVTARAVLAKAGRR